METQITGAKSESGSDLALEPAWWKRDIRGSPLKAGDKVKSFTVRAGNMCEKMVMKKKKKRLLSGLGEWFNPIKILGMENRTDSGVGDAPTGKTYGGNSFFCFAHSSNPITGSRLHGAFVE